jgi:hypothetical protein
MFYNDIINTILYIRHIYWQFSADVKNSWNRNFKPQTTLHQQVLTAVPAPHCKKIHHDQMYPVPSAVAHIMNK